MLYDVVAYALFRRFSPAESRRAARHPSEHTCLMMMPHTACHATPFFAAFIAAAAYADVIFAAYATMPVIDA